MAQKITEKQEFIVFMGKTIDKNISVLMFTAIFSVAMLSSCLNSNVTRTEVDPNDMSYLYNPTENILNPDFKVLSTSDFSANLMIRLSASELFFSEANEAGIPQANIGLSALLYEIDLGRTLADTAYADLSVIKDESLSEYIFEIPLKTEKGVEYMAEVRILDKTSRSTHHSYVPFNTLSDQNMYNFALHDYIQGNEVFEPVIRTDEFYNLVYNRKPIDSIYISFYEPFVRIPDPPSMTLPQRVIDYEPLQVVPLAYSDTLALMFSLPGIYKINVERDIQEGYTLYNLGTDFPAMTTPESMIEPLVYLTSESELNRLRSEENLKLALDDFWISCGGNIERARELIRVYYTRAVYANYYFTSFTEGWRTERGMIYLLYGPPDKLYKTIDGESWGYRKPIVRRRWGNTVQLEENYLFFTFKKRESVYSDNDFYLSRSESLVSNWDQAVNSWRDGVIFRLDNPTDF